METLHVRTTRRAEMVEMTDRVRGVVRASGVKDGIVVAQSLHTTAALTLNENADPDVPHDLIAKLEALIPRDEPFYRHAEGNSDSHLKTSFFGPSLTLIVTGGDLLLGQWQGVWLAEFDGPRERAVAVQVVGAAVGG